MQCLQQTQFHYLVILTEMMHTAANRRSNAPYDHNLLTRPVSQPTTEANRSATVLNNWFPTTTNPAAWSQLHSYTTSSLQLSLWSSGQMESNDKSGSNWISLIRRNDKKNRARRAEPRTKAIVLASKGQICVMSCSSCSVWFENWDFNCVVVKH